MAKYLLPHFGEIDLSALEESYETKIDLNQSKIRININFDNKTIDPSKMDIVKTFLEHIDQFDKQNNLHINNDYNNEDGVTVKEFVEFHIDEFDKEDLAQLVDFGNNEVTPEQQLLNKLKLERLGLYPDGKYDSIFAVFDYTFEGNVYVDGVRTITDQIIVVKTDETGQLDHLTCES